MAFKTTTNNRTVTPSRAGTIPYLVRTLTREIAQLTGAAVGVPMNFRLPPVSETEETLAGTAKLSFEGSAWRIKIRTSRGHFGQEVQITSVQGKVGFWCREVALTWLQTLWRSSGPVHWEFVPANEYAPDGDGKLFVTIEGVALDRLMMNASNRRNELPEYSWDDVESPIPTTEEETATAVPEFIATPREPGFSGYDLVRFSEPDQSEMLDEEKA